MTSSGTKSDVLDVLVIGGGFSGLSAARELESLGVKFRLLDSYEDHLGGRAYSYDANIPEGTKLRYDHGAEYVGDAQNAIMAQVKELLPAGSLVNGANLRIPYLDEVMVLNQERYCFKSTDSLFGIPGAPPQLGFLAAVGMIGALAEMTMIEIMIDTMAPWNGPSWLLDLDKIDVWTWLGQKKWVVPTVKDLMRISIEALLSVEPSQISPYYLLWYTACNDGFLNEINDDVGGPQQYWLATGTSSLAERYAEPVRSKVTQGTKATSIDLTGDVVKVETSAGETILAKKVLVATSPATAGRIAYQPEPPPARKALMAQPMGTTLKCQIFYKSAFWHDSNGLKYDGYVGGADYPILWVMDNSAADGGAPHVLMTFTVGSQLASLGPNPSKEEIVTFITGTLRDLFLDDRALAGSSEFIRLDHYFWTPDEANVGGGPNTVFTPGMLTGDAGKIMDQSWDDKVFFACAENAKSLTPISTSPKYEIFGKENLPQYDAQNVLLGTSVPPFYSKYSDMRSDLGYMSGAMESGRYAAHEIAASLGIPEAIALPKPCATASSPPPPANPLEREPTVEADIAEAILAAIKTELLGPSGPARIAGFRRSGLAGKDGLGAFFQELVARVLSARGHDVSASDPSHALEVLRHVRDFAATCGHHLVADGENAATNANADATERLRAHVDDIDRALTKA